MPHSKMPIFHFQKDDYHFYNIPARQVRWCNASSSEFYGLYIHSELAKSEQINQKRKKFPKKGTHLTKSDRFNKIGKD